MKRNRYVALAVVAAYTGLQPSGVDCPRGVDNADCCDRVCNFDANLEPSELQQNGRERGLSAKCRLDSG